MYVPTPTWPSENAGCAQTPLNVTRTIYDVAPGVLQGFDKSLSEFAAEKFKRQGVAVKGESHITRVHEGHLEVKEEGDVPFGLLVWATGLEANPLIESITELKKDDQTHVCVCLFRQATPYRLAFRQDHH